MAKTKESSTPERLQELITERQRYETWLASIAIRRDSAPEHVVARVEEDYRGRLARIREELASRAGELRERIDGLSEQLAEIKLHEAARRDERAEAELRTSVGEMSPGQWAEISESADRAISEYETNRKVIERDLAELEQILSTVTWSEMSGAPAAAPPPDATRTARPAAKPAAPARTVATSSPPPAPPAAPAATAASRPAPRPAPVPQRPAAAGAPAPQAAAAEPATAATTVSSSARAGSTGAPPPGSESQRRKDPSQREGQEKTLLCGECGTANYPTEWYCEACGAELSNL